MGSRISFSSFVLSTFRCSSSNHSFSMLSSIMSAWTKTDSEDANNNFTIPHRFHDGWVVVESPEAGFACSQEPAENVDPLSDLLSAAGEGVVRFGGGKAQSCTRADIQFRYIDHLHYGSFGDLVTRAEYTPTSEQIVAKIIRIFDRLSGKNDGRSMGDILRKMDIAKQMRHENIVRLHGFVIEEMTCYMVMEPLSASLSEVVSALAFLLEIKICTVLSPKRILIGDDGTVKISASAVIESGGAIPVRYSAPELLESGADKDYSKSCVWSLAILLIEAATGQNPFSGSIDFVIADQITDCKIQPRLSKDFSHRMMNFVDACLFHSPQSRASVSAMDANGLQNKRFYRLHAQSQNRKESVKAILQKALPHLKELRKEK